MDNTPQGPVCSKEARERTVPTCQSQSRRISRRRTEEANNYYTDIFCFMCDLNEYVYLTASRIFVFVTVRKGKVRTVSVERQHICRHHGCVNSAEKIRLSYQVIHCWHNFYTQVKVWISFVTFHIWMIFFFYRTLRARWTRTCETH